MKRALKRVVGMLMATVMIVGMSNVPVFACGTDETDGTESKLVKTIQVYAETKKDVVTLDEMPVQFCAEVTPETADNKEVSWSVENTEEENSVDVKISEEGILNVGSAGNYKITATAKDGSKVSGEMFLNVQEGEKNQSKEVNEKVSLLEKDLKWINEIQKGKWTIDSETKGNWTEKYGKDGYVLCAWDNTRDVNNFPYYIDSVEYLTEDRSGGYVARSAESADGNTWWENGIPNADNPDGTRKIAYRFDDKRQTVRIKANDSDEHIITFYVASENDNGKEQDIQLFKAGTKEEISETVTVKNFMDGKYVTTTFKGSIDAVFTNTNYKPLSTNALVNGIFFDTHYEEGKIPVRRVSIAPVDGETIRTETDEVQMKAVVYPENASDQKMTWSISEGTDVASVDANGKITIFKEGVFKVKAVSHDPEVWNEVTMACIPKGSVPETTEWKMLGEDYVIFQNKNVKVIFDLTTGQYNIYDQESGNPYVLGAYYQINDQKSIDERTFEVEEQKSEAGTKKLRLMGTKEGSYGIILDILLEDNSGNILMSAGIDNTSEEDVKVMQMYPMVAKYQEKGGIFVGPDPAENHAVLTGEGNWTVPQVKQTVNTTSKNNLMISYRNQPEKESFLIGQLTTYSFQSTITTNYNPQATLENEGRKSIDGDIRIYDNTGKLVDNKDVYVGDTALVNFTEKNPYDSLQRYAEKQAKAMDVQLMDFDPYIYECLWYVNWFTPNANNADFAVQEVKDLYKKGLANYARPNLRVEPDTYENPNEQLWWDDEHWKAFGHLTDTYPTMKDWIKGMKEAGGEGGTYMQASYRSDDYCEKNPGHMLYNDPQEGPDYTDPDFIEHMSEVYTNLKDAGLRSIFYDYAGQYHGKPFGYLLDQKGGFEDKHATAVEAYRNIFALPKQYIGRDVRITENSWEHSGSDVAIGLIDFQRNIHDTNEFSPSIAQVAINQWYRHRTTKLLYPDVKVFENNDIDLRRAQITGTAFLFGKMTLGESVNRMSDDKIKDVGKTVPFPINGISARPVGLFENDYVEKGLTNPEVLDYKFKSEYDDHILLFWNETQEAKTISADLGKDTAFGGVGLDPEKEYDVWDFWDWNYLGRVKGSEMLSLPVRKNEMKTMAVREVRDTPYLLSTNRHLLQGTEEIEAKDIQWNESDKTFTGTFEIVANDTFKAIIPVPEGLVLENFEIDNENVVENTHFNTAGRYVEVVLDAKENQSVPFVIQFEEGETPKDTTSPSEIRGLRAKADDFGSVTLTWDESTDESGSVYYEVYGSSEANFEPSVETKLAITTKTEYTSGAAPEGDFYYMVIAKDAAQNASSPATVKTNAKVLAIALEQLEATSGNNQDGQDASKVLDEKDNTLWHTSWSGEVDRDDMWVDLHIKNGPAVIGSLKYLPRSDQSTTSGLVKNGIIVKYRVDISKDHGKTYETLIKEGTFDDIKGWQTITFEEPVEITNVRLYCLESADSGNKWASAAEMRLYSTTEFEGISMREPSISMNIGEEETLIVDFFPTNFQKEVEFSSDNENVAQVDKNGVVRGISRGNAVITAKVDGKIAKCKVWVYDNRTDLEALIAYAQEAKESPSYEYLVPAVKELFEKALADAVAVNENENATQEEIKAAYNTLLEKVHLLDFTGNSESLKVLVDVAKGKIENMYTEETWAPFKEALETAEEVLANENALQAEIDAVRDRLQNAMDHLVKIPVDKTKLQELVDESKKYEDKLKEYTLSTREIFAGALQNAREVLANEEATQEEVDAAYVALQNAIFGLRLIPDKDKLEELIKEAEKADFSKYTEQSSGALKTALEYAKSVFADENATEKDVKEAEKKLSVAMNGLKLVSNDNNQDDNNNDNGNNNGGISDNKADKGQPKTGDNTNMAWLFVIAFVSGIVLFRRRKSSN